MLLDHRGPGGGEALGLSLSLGAGVPMGPKLGDSSAELVVQLPEECQEALGEDLVLAGSRISGDGDVGAHG